MDFKKYIEDIKDFPEEGIIFRDVTPLLKDKEAYKESIDTFAKWIDGLGVQVDVVAGPEARGFLFGCPVGGKVVGIAFLIELEALKGREKLKDYNVYSVLTY